MAVFLLILQQMIPLPKFCFMQEGKFLMKSVSFNWLVKESNKIR